MPDGQSAVGVLNPTPTIASTILSQGSAAGGSTFAIFGTGFALGTTVTIGGTPAEILAVTPTSVVVSTPPGSPGPVSVIVMTPGGCSAVTLYEFPLKHETSLNSS